MSAEITETQDVTERPYGLDGHRVRITLGRYGTDWELVCPHPTPTPAELGSDEIPYCRREYAEDGITWERADECLLPVGFEGPDTLTKAADTDPDLVLADFPVLWEWPHEDGLYLHPVPAETLGRLTADGIRFRDLTPIQLRDTALSLLGRVNRAQQLAVDLEWQNTMLRRLAAVAASTMFRLNQQEAAEQFRRILARITDPDGSLSPEDQELLDRTLAAEPKHAAPDWTEAADWDASQRATVQ